LNFLFIVIEKFPHQFEAAQLFSTLVIIKNQHIIMISEGSCDSNDAENSALHHWDKLHMNICTTLKYSYLIVILNLNNISLFLR